MGDKARGIAGYVLHDGLFETVFGSQTGFGVQLCPSGIEGLRRLLVAVILWGLACKLGLQVEQCGGPPGG